MIEFIYIWGSIWLDDNYTPIVHAIDLTKLGEPYPSINIYESSFIQTELS